MDFSFFHHEISDSVKQKINNKDFDGAIFDAACYVEAKIQKIGKSKSINTSLIKEVFENGSLKISEDKERNVGGQNIFDGLFRLIRNDRGHHKDTEEKVELLCTTEEDCLKYLGTISLLLYYLDLNLANKPKIDSINISENIELAGNNFTQNSIVLTNGEESPTISIEPTKIVLKKPKENKGIIQVVNKNIKSNIIDYLIPPEKHQNEFIVIANNIPLFSDKDCTKQIDKFCGVKYMVYEKGKSFTRISPTTITYKVGSYINTSDVEFSDSCGETWYKDPLNKGKVKYAWTGSAIFNGGETGTQGEMKETQLFIRPEKITSGQNEIRVLRAIVIESDGRLKLEKDVSHEVEWTSDNESIAGINRKNSTVHLKGIGQTKIKAKYKGLHDTIDVDIITPVRLTKVKYFCGNIQRYQQIRFDTEDNLYITNQSQSIYLLNKEGFKEFIRLPEQETEKGISDYPSSIDSLSTTDKDLYFNCITPKRGLFKYSNKKIIPIGEEKGTVKSITVDSRKNVYFADMEKEIVRIDEYGTTHILPIDITSVNLRLINDDKIIVGSAGGGSIIKIYSTKNGELLKDIKNTHIHSPTDIAIKGTDILIGDFHNGEVWKINVENENCEKIAEGLGNIGGLDLDSEGNLYVSIFDAKENNNICIYKIYL